MSTEVQSRRASPKLRHSESLAAIISQAGPLPEEQVWAVMDQLLQRAEGLHKQGKCHRCFSLSTIGIDASGELEIADTDAPLSISELVRLHAPLPSCLRHEFELVLPQAASDASISLSHAGFGGDAAALDLFQIAVLTIKLIFDVDSEKFLASPCLHETLTPELCKALKQRLAAEGSGANQSRYFRTLLPGAEIGEATPLDASHSLPEGVPTAPMPPGPVIAADTLAASEGSPTSVAEPLKESVAIGTTPAPMIAETSNTNGPAIVSRELESPQTDSAYTSKAQKATSKRTFWTIGGLLVALIVGLGLATAALLNMEFGR